MTSDKTMTCVECGRKKAYPDAFPDRAYAECWPCFWALHVAQQHKPKRNRWGIRITPGQRKTIEKAVRRD